MTNEQKFEIHYGALLDEAQQITGHAFPRLRELIAERTAVGAARYLLSPVASAGFSWGFELLAAAKLLSHSIEQAALDFAYSGLFSDEQLSKARAQLAIARMLWRGITGLRHTTSMDES